MMRISASTLATSSSRTSLSTTPGTFCSSLRQGIKTLTSGARRSPGSADGVDTSHPFDRPGNPLLEHNARIVPEGLLRLRDVRSLVLHVVRLFRQVLDPPVVLAEIVEDQAAGSLDTRELTAADVEHLTRREVLAGVGQRGDEIVDVHKDALIALVDRVRQVVEGSVAEQAHD